MPAVVPSSPSSDDGSLAFDSSSEGISTPSERVSTTAIDGLKDIAPPGVAVHSPPPVFVGTPFATSTGPNTLFEYPFPPTRPALSTASSISSVAPSILGPPSPATRAKYIPRLSQNQSSSTVRRRFSGNSPRVPPRLRTDSSGSVASVQSAADEPTPKTAPGAMTSASRPPPLSRLRDRSGSLGVLPIQLPPPSFAMMGLGGPPAGPMSPAALVDAMEATGLAVTMTPWSEGEGEGEQAASASEKRRASVPALFAPQLGEDLGSDSGLDRGDVEDTPA